MMLNQTCTLALQQGKSAKEVNDCLFKGDGNDEWSKMNRSLLMTPLANRNSQPCGNIHCVIKIIGDNVGKMLGPPNEAEKQLTSAQTCLIARPITLWQSERCAACSRVSS